MKTKKAYIAPKIKSVNPGSGVILQEVVHFSGGDKTGTGIVIYGEDDGDGSNRVIRWTNHLWDD